MMRSLFLLCIWSLICLPAVPSLAATYYVKNTGNDSADGTSDATAWKSIRKVNRYPFKTGDDLFFRCGDKWIGKTLKIGWSGTASDPVVIGAYDLKDGREVRGISVAGRPVFDGNNAVPHDLYSGLIHMRGHEYVTIENLRLTNSEGAGVIVYKSNHINCKNLEVYRTYFAGILYKDCHHGTIEQCDLQNVSQVYVETRPYEVRPANLELFRCDDIIIRKNTVRESWGEGIGVYWHCTDCIVEENLVYANKMAGIYLDNTKQVHVRRNLIYGTTDPSFHRSKGFMGPGLWTDDEPGRVAKYGTQNGNKFYHNLVAFCSSGVYLSTSDKGSVLKNTDVFNNTIIGCRIGINITGGPWKNSHIRNNIVRCAGKKCQLFSGPSRTPGLTWSHNNWSSQLSGAASGPGDVIGLPRLRKSEGWLALRGGELNGSEFALEAGSPAIDTGLPLDVGFSEIPECNTSDWRTGNIVLTDQGKQGRGWEIGADVYAVTP